MTEPIKHGDRVVFEDVRGTCWWGTAVSPVLTVNGYPEIRVMVGRVARLVPARDVTPARGHDEAAQLRKPLTPLRPVALKAVPAPVDQSCQHGCTDLAWEMWCDQCRDAAELAVAG